MSGKRAAEALAEPAKRVKTEVADLLTDDLDELLNTQMPSTNPGFDMGNIDFNNLPDELLDSVDATVATPEGGSRAATPDIKMPNMRYPSNLQVPMSQQSSQSQAGQPQSAPATNLHSNDPTKLNDALAAAGVDIHQEEELLTQQRLNRMRQNPMPAQYSYNQKLASHFLNPYHVATFMHRLAKENGVMQNFLQDVELLELMSGACEKWMSDMVTKTLMMSQHRQRSQPIGKAKTTNSKTSDIHQELRNLARRHRELEERRVERRIALGLEKPDENGKDEAGKAGADETLHKAANATAAMMTMNPGRKKYSWMTSGNGASAGADTPTNDKDSQARRSHLLAVRGENGIRLNNTRISQAVTMKDLLAAIEDERMGVDKAIVKGYSKLRD